MSDRNSVVTISSALHSGQIFDALGDETRRQILFILRQGPQPVGGIAAQLPVSRPAVSRHLKMLRRAGLVSSAASGTRNLFRIDTNGFQLARDYLDGFWDVALANFQDLVEAEGRDRA